MIKLWVFWGFFFLCDFILPCMMWWCVLGRKYVILMCCTLRVWLWLWCLSTVPGCDLFKKYYFTKKLLYIIVYVSLPLFGFLCVCCVCDDRISCVLYVSRWQCMRGWGELRSSHNLFSCFKSDTKDYVIFFSQFFFGFVFWQLTFWTT